jgi:effector-binding domain-containing protein
MRRDMKETIGIYYRGIFCKTEKEYKQLIEEVKNGTITYHTITSWSHLPSIAEQFAKGAGYYSYTHEPSVKGFKGVVLKAEPIYKESTFFSSMEVGEELEEEYEEFFKNREPERIFHHNEEEIVLLQGTYPVTI